MPSPWAPWDIAVATGGSGGGGNCSAAVLAVAASLLALEVGRVLDIVLAMFQTDRWGSDLKLTNQRRHKTDTYECRLTLQSLRRYNLLPSFQRLQQLGLVNS
jgi:hypothetical protein